MFWELLETLYMLWSFFKGSIIPEIQNRVRYYDVTNPVTNSKTLFLFVCFIFRVSNSMWKKVNIDLELVTWDFKENKISELLARKIKNL